MEITQSKNKSLLLTAEDIFQYVPFFRVLFRMRRSMNKQAQIARNRKSLLISILVEVGCLFLLYLALAPVFAMPLYNAIIFHPIPETDDLTDQIHYMEKFFHCSFQSVQFKAPDGESLSGWFLKVPGAKKTIMVSHGNGGCMKHRLALCPLLLQSGCSVFMYDYEGFGDSTGKPTVPHLCDDAVAAFDYLTANLDVRASDVILYGESIGTGVVSELSTKRKAGAVVLQSPFTSLHDAGRDLIFFLKLYPSWAFPAPGLSNLAIMKNAHPPLLILHGMKDDMLSYHHSEKIMQEASEPKSLVLLPHAGHVDIYKVDVDLSMAALDKFIARLP